MKDYANLIGITACLAGSALQGASSAFAAVCTNLATTHDCTVADTYPLIVLSFIVPSGSHEVETSDLQEIPGHNGFTPDTVLWILAPNLTDLSVGAVVGIDDDSGPGFGSRVSFTTSSTTLIFALVANWGDTHHGTCDVTIKTNGVTTQSFDNLPFGGYNITHYDIRAGDRIIVGFPPGGSWTGALANRLFLFSNHSVACTSNCGTFAQGQWDAGSLSQRVSPFTQSLSRITVGSLQPSGGPLAVVSTRLLHARLGTGWGGGNAFLDADCDGLPRELEEQLGTCDGVLGGVQGPSNDCKPTTRRKFSSATGFHPSDTDGDGLRDDVEVYGIKVDCPKAPVAPFYDTGVCTNVTYTRTACPLSPTPTGVFTASNAISTLSPSPRELDFFVETKSLPGGPYTTTQLAKINYSFETEGLQCVQNTTQSGCSADLDDYDFVDVHISSQPDAQWAYVPGYLPFGYWMAAPHINAQFEPARKNTGTFRYAWLAPFYTGFSLGAPGRFSLVIAGDGLWNDGLPMIDTVISRNFVHEAGHSLGIPGDSSALQPNYISQMNYATAEVFPAKQSASTHDLWPDDFGASCPPCSQGICLQGSCDVDCQIEEVRFSRGTNLTLSEVSQSETGQPVQITTQARCVQSADFAGTCSQGPCRVDWDQDGDFNGSTSVDFNGDGIATSILADIDDWKVIRNQMKYGVSLVTPVSKDLLVFGSSFTLTTAPTDSSGFGNTPVVSAGVANIPSFHNHGNAFHFSGPCTSPCTPDNVFVPDHPAIDSVSRTIDSVAPRGFRFDAFVRFDTFTNGLGHQVVDSALFRIYVRNSDRSVWLSVFNGTTWTPVGIVPGLVTNRWYWIVALWNRNTASARIYAIPRAYSDANWEFTNGVCGFGAVTAQSEVNLTGLRLGMSTSSPSTYALSGRLDYPHLWNFIPPGDGESCAWVENDIASISCGSGLSLCGE